MSMSEVGIRLLLEGQQAVQSGIQNVNSRLGDLDSGARQAATGAKMLQTAMASFATVGAVTAFIKMADSVTTLNTQLRLSSNSAGEATKAYGALFDIAQKGRVSFTDLGTTYAAIARAGKELGVSQTRLLDVTKSISQAMTIGGGSAASMQAALIQLGQGLSSGTLRGEELNSVMEQTPRLAQAIADGLGVPIGKLREMGAAGQITSQQLIMALEKAGPQLAKEMASATLTVGQAMTMLSNSTVKMVGDADAASGASATLAGALKNVSGAVDTIGSAINNNQTAFAALSGGLGGAAAVAGLAAVAANIGKIRTAILALNVAMVNNPVTLALLGLGAAAGAAYSMVDAKSKTLEGMKTRLAELQASDGTGMYGTKASDAAIKKRLEDIARLQASIAELEASTNNAYGAEDARLARHTEAYKNNLAARAAFEKEGQAYLSKAQKNQATLNAEIDKNRALLDNGTISATEYAQRINAVQASFAKATPSVKGLSDAQTQAAKAAEDLIKSYTAQAQTLADARNKEYAAIEDYMAAQRLASLQDANAADAAVRAAQEELDQHGQLRSAIADTTAAKMAQRLLNMTAGTEEYTNLQRQIDAQRQLAGIYRQGEARDAAQDGAKKAATEWEKASEKIEQDITDALMRGFESGESMAENLKNVLENTFKTMVLRPMVQAVVQPFADVATSAISSAGSSITGSVLGNAAQSYGLSSLAAASGTAFAAGSAMGAEAFSAGITMMSEATGLSSFAAGASQAAGSALAVAGPYIAAIAAISMIHNATQGETRSGATYGYSFDGESVYNPRIAEWLGSSYTDTSRQDRFNAESGITAPGSVYLEGPSGGDPGATVVSQAMDATVLGINNLFSTLGSDLAVTQFTGAYESSEKGRGGVFSGGTLSTGVGFGEYGGVDGTGRGGTGAQYSGLLFETTSSQSPDVQTALANFSTDLLQVTIQALQAGMSELPQTIQDMLTGVDAEALTSDQAGALMSTINAVIGEVTAFNLAAEAMPFESLKNLSFDAAAGLIAAAGGMDNLGAALSGYYDNFYTAEEKTANLTRATTDAFASLGETMPAADASMRDWYRTLVESKMALDQSVPANAQATAAVLALQGAVNTLAPAFESAAQALDKTNQTWLDKLALLTGAETERSIALRDATDDSTRAIMRQVYAQEDAMQAIEDTSAAFERASAAFESATSAVEAAASALATAQSAVDGVRTEATSAYISAQSAYASAQQRIADIQQSALQATERAAYDAAEKLIDLGKTLTEFVQGALSTPEQSFADTLRKALAGDAEAMAALPNAATSASDAAGLAASTSTDARLAQAKIMSDVLRVANLAAATALPGMTAEADPMVEATATLAAAQSEMAAALGVVTAIGASTTASVTDLIAKYALAQEGVAKAQADMAAAQATLDAAVRALESIQFNTLGLTASIINGFDGMDLNIDGVLTLAELKSAGLASDSAIESLFNMMDTNNDGVISKLEAIRLNTLLTAQNIGDYIAQSITDANNAAAAAGSASEIGLTDFRNIVSAAATAQGVSPTLVTAGFTSGLFNTLDANASGGLSASENSTSAITSALSNLLAQSAGTGGTSIVDPIATLSAYDNTILASPLYQVGIPVTAGERAAAALYTKYLYRKPEQKGMDDWEAYYNAQIASGTGSITAGLNLDKAFKNAIAAQLVSISDATSSKQAIVDYWLGNQMTNLGATTLASRYFATGGAFTNSLVSSPTAFDIGVMGEAGPEAIMPLNRMSNGDLGVQVQMPDWNKFGRDPELVNEIRALRADNQAQARAIVALQSRLTKVVERWDGTGLPEERAVA